MKMDQLAGSGKDEFYTPRYAVEPIAKYVREGAGVWCPFDTERSQFVEVFKRNGNPVYYSHIWEGRDFFKEHPPSGAEYIISNPPYSIKGQVFERLFEIGLPFAMLVGVVGLFESQKRFEMFRDNDFEIMYLNRRVSYFEDFEALEATKNPPFSSVYLTHKMLPNRIVFEEIVKRRGGIDA